MRLAHRSHRPLVRFLGACTLAIAAATATAADADLGAALELTRIAVKLADTPLESAVYRILGEVAVAARVVWDPQVTGPLGRVNLEASDQPAGEILRQVLAMDGLDYAVKGSDLVIVPARDQVCVAREAAQQRFLAKGIIVDVIAFDQDRCKCRAVIDGTATAEGAKIGDDITVGMILPHTVIFHFEGYLFALDSRTSPPPIAAPRRNGAKEVDEPPSFGDLELRLGGYIYDRDHPEIWSAYVNDYELKVGDPVPGIEGLSVAEIQDGAVIFEYQGERHRMTIGR